MRRCRKATEMRAGRSRANGHRRDTRHLLEDWTCQPGPESPIMNQNKLVTQKQGESVPGEDQPVRRNSSLALERLSSLADQLAGEGARLLRTEERRAGREGAGTGMTGWARTI